MKLFLKVPIICSVNRGKDTVDYEALGLVPRDEDQNLESRDGAVRIDKITSWYPNVEHTGTLVELGPDVYVIDLKVKEFEDLLSEFIYNPIEEKLI